MEFLFTLSVGIFILSSLFFLVSLFGIGRQGLTKKCTESGTAVIEKVYNEARSDTGTYFRIHYFVQGIPYTVNVPAEHTEGISPDIPAGEQVPIWYRPDKPTTVIITRDKDMKNSLRAWRGFRKRAVFWMIFSLIGSVICMRYCL